MASRTPLDLRADEFAFLFDSDAGVDADKLGTFLRRAATVGRQAGAELRVVGLVPGSLAVIVRTVAKSARAEFKKTPIAATAAGAALVGSVVTAITMAMAPSHKETTPLARSGAELIDRRQTSNISVVTVNQTIVVMDPVRADRILEAEDRRKLKSPSSEVRNLIASGRDGVLEGEVFLVDGELHFRPDGYRYLVPINIRSSDAIETLYPDQRFRVTADIVTRNGQPDTIVIHEARRV